MLESEIQSLICHHPYLLDSDIRVIGRRERTITGGRIDIDFFTPTGTIVVECKREELRNADVFQLRNYLNSLVDSGEIVSKAYLVGRHPIDVLDSDSLNKKPVIIVRELVTSVPLHLAFCRGGHYYDIALRRCPYCGDEKVPGANLFLS